MEDPAVVRRRRAGVALNKNVLAVSGPGVPGPSDVAQVVVVGPTQERWLVGRVTTHVVARFSDDHRYHASEGSDVLIPARRRRAGLTRITVPRHGEIVNGIGGLMGRPTTQIVCPIEPSHENEVAGAG